MARFLFCVACTFLFCGLSNDVGAVIYRLNGYSMTDAPYSPESDMTMYTISGFLETDGTLGQLERGNIVDYEFDISGMYSLTMDPSTPNVSFGFANLLASETELQLPVNDDGEVEGRLTVGTDFEYDDEFSPYNCNECYVIFEYGDRGRMSTQHFGGSGPGPGVRFWFVDEGTRDLADASFAIPNSGSFVIATVPEPDCTQWLIIALVVGVTRLRKRG